MLQSKSLREIALQSHKLHGVYVTLVLLNW